MLKVQFEYQRNELRAGIRALTRAARTWPRLRDAAAWTILAAMVLWLLGAAIINARRIVAAHNFHHLLFSSIGMLALWIAAPVIILRMTAGTFGVRPGEPWTLEADENLLTLTNLNRRWERRWSSSSKLVETKKFFLIFTAPKTALVIPKRIFDTASLDEFRRLAQEHISPQTRGFPVIPLAERSQSQDQSQH